MSSSAMEEPKLPGGYLVTPRVPQGLAAAVEGLTREVLRHSPEDIYVFAAHHFEKLLSIRERCGPEEIATNRDSNVRTLREMSQALRAREFDLENTRSTKNPSDHVGWSLNQTAKVLKRHRSIFGDAGRRISTDEVFQMANQKENHSRISKQLEGRNQSRRNVEKREESRCNEKSSNQMTNEVWKASTSRTDRSWSNEDSPEISETRSAPKMISQMSNLQSSSGLLAKDIKSELRKNRISSRERRNVRAKPEEKSNVDRTDVKQSGKVSGRNLATRKSSERLKRMETETEKRNRRSVESTKSSKDGQYGQRTPESRAMSMDRVKDYVVQRFATTKSLEELQDLNYVEKVQGIIDETGPIIKGKVEELKSGMIGRSKRSSWFSESRNDRRKGSNDSLSDNRSSAGNSNYKDSVESSEVLRQSNDALKYRLTETQNILENVSSKMTRPRRSRSARSSRRSGTNEEIVASRDLENDGRTSNFETLNTDNGLERRLSKTKNLLEDISSVLSGPMRRASSAKSLRRQDDDEVSDFGSKDALKTRLDETRNLLEGISANFVMPGHRVGSSKGRRSRRAIGNVGPEEISLSDSQNISKVSLPAVRSTSAKSSSGSVSRSDSDNLVLPAISPEAPKSKKIKEDLVLPALSPPATGSSNDASKTCEDDVFAEEDIPEIPVEDYIPEAIGEDVFRDSLNVTPDFDNIPQRPDSLEPLEIIEDIEDKTTSDNLEAKLQEIQKVEKDIEEVFASKTLKTPNDVQYAEELGEPGMKQKLQELEEAEKRIERILDSEVVNDDEDPAKSETEVDVSGDIFEGSRESGRNVEEEIETEKASVRDSDGNDEEEDEERKNNKQETRKLVTSSPESLNYTYVLTEGSPYEIPDTVTTVIIPERSVESPESDRLDVVLEEGEDVKLTLIPGDIVKKQLKDVVEIDETVVEENEIDVGDKIDEKVVEEVDEDVIKENEQPEGKLLSDHEEMEKRSPSVSPKNGSKEDDSTLKKDSDPFGELVEPEPIPSNSADMDFIRGIESRQEMHISHQDLDRINEEMSEELEEGLENTEKTVETPTSNIGQIDEERNEGKDTEIVETAEESKKGETEEIIDSSDGPKPEEKSEHDEIKNVEVVEIITTPETTKATNETTNEAEASSDSSVIQGQKDKEDDEDNLPEVSEADKTQKMIEATERTEGKGAEEAVNSPDGPIIHPEREDNENRTSDVDKPKTKTESDLSPFGQNLDSSSSNEAKESSGPDEPLESAKCANSADEEESSDTRSPESSNEVKETTLTDGLSLSLDPTRPFVPELNLDSLQDITVSSFKMTEDEYENQGHPESANTNSMTETLTSDENHRIIESDLPEEAVMEYLVSSSERSKLKEAEVDQAEVVEERIEKSPVEIKEDICVKDSAYVTGPDNQRDNVTEVQQQSQNKEKEESGKGGSAENSRRDEEEEIEEKYKAEENSTTEQEEMENLAVDKAEHEEMVDERIDIPNVSAEDEKEETAEDDKTEQKTPSELEKVEDLHAEISELKKEDSVKSPKTEEKEEIQVENDKEADEVKAEQRSPNELEEMENLAVEKEENSGIPEDEKERNNQENENQELSATEEENNKAVEESFELQSLTPEEKKNEEIKDNENVSSESALAEVVDDKMEDQTTKSDVLSNEDRSVEDEEKRKVSEEETEVKNLVDYEEERKAELPVTERSNTSTEEKSDAQTSTFGVAKNEEIKEDDNQFSESAIINDAKIVDHKIIVQTTESADLSCEVKSVEEVSEKPDAQTSTSDVEKNEEINEDDNESSKSAIIDAEIVGRKMIVQTTESADLSCEVKSVEEMSDEILEESFVEEDTPLAVSRSASQCTTRRVSSGNLAKLREDPTLGWTEESEREIGNDEEANPSKLKFSKIGGETIKEQGSDEIDQSQNSGSPKNISDDADGSLTKDSREYHIYVPEVDASEDNSTTESSTVDSAVTKIQARVRGFLTRRRMHRGQHNRSSTLNSIPSIQDSIVGEPYNIDDHQLEAEKQSTEAAEKANISSSLTPDEPGLENAATRIQSNYRGYKSRKRLRREDAVQRTTLSLEKSFAESGLQHTGEFHDCIPLPLHDIAVIKKLPNSNDDDKLDPLFQKSSSSSLEDKEIGSRSKNTENIKKSDNDMTQSNPEEHQNHGQMFFGQQSKVPVIQFGMIPNIGHLVDLVVLAKEESALESSYLNFITSVEDTEIIEPNSEIKINGKNFTDSNISSDILKRPPAFSEPPVGVIIEEITSSEIESFLNNGSPDTEIKETEMEADSSGSVRAPCASSENISDSSGNSKTEEVVADGQIAEKAPETPKFSSGNGEILVVSEEEMIKNFGISGSFSSSQKMDLLGPESSVDSMECPVVGSEEKSSSTGSGEDFESSKIEKKVEEACEKKIIIGDQKDSSSGSDVIKENTKEEETVVSNVNKDISSTVSFSLKVEDFLDGGSEDSTELHKRKPILEVTLTPGDIMKSMSLSQESQLAGERIESPITMVQMAPARSESLQLEEPSESGCEDEKSEHK